MLRTIQHIINTLTWIKGGLIDKYLDFRELE